MKLVFKSLVVAGMLTGWPNQASGLIDKMPLRFVFAGLAGQDEGKASAQFGYTLRGESAPVVMMSGSCGLFRNEDAAKLILFSHVLRDGQPTPVLANAGITLFDLNVAVPVAASQARLACG